MREIEVREQEHREAEERIEQASALGRIDEGNEDEAAASSRPGTSGGIVNVGLGDGTGAGLPTLSLPPIATASMEARSISEQPPPAVLHGNQP